LHLKLRNGTHIYLKPNLITRHGTIHIELEATSGKDVEYETYNERKNRSYAELKENVSIFHPSVFEVEEESEEVEEKQSIQDLKKDVGKEVETEIEIERKLRNANEIGKLKELAKKETENE